MSEIITMVSTVNSLVLKGKIRAAKSICETFPNHDYNYDLFLKNVFSNRDREILPGFLLGNLSKTSKGNNPLIIKNIITLAEMNGDIHLLKAALNKFDELLSDEEFIRLAKVNEKCMFNAFIAAFYLFEFESADKFHSYAKEMEFSCCDEMERMVASLELMSGLIRYDLRKLSLVSQAFKKTKVINITKPTIVVRLSSNDIRVTQTSGLNLVKKNLPAMFNYSEILSELNWDVIYAPQHSLPGPAFSLPFVNSANVPLIFVDCHKFSDPKNFIHVKMVRNGYFQVEREGYSGWLSITRNPAKHDYDLLTSKECEQFCEDEKNKLFSNSIIADDSIFKKLEFGLIPLQMPGDSVQKLAYIDYFKMIMLCIDFFKSRGLKTVITRHPQCKDIEVSNFLEELTRNTDCVIISNESTRSLILDSKVIALFNSSVGWDAILANKPILSFARSEYSRVTCNIEYPSDLYEIENFEDLVCAAEYKKIYTYFWKYYTASTPEGLKQKLMSSALAAASYSTR